MSDEQIKKIPWSPKTIDWSKFETYERSSSDEIRQVTEKLYKATEARRQEAWRNYFESRERALDFLRRQRADFGLRNEEPYDTGCDCDMCKAVKALDAEERAKRAASNASVALMPLALVHVLEEITQANVEGWTVKALYVNEGIYDAIAALPSRDYPMIGLNSRKSGMYLTVYGIPVVFEKFLAEPVVASKYPPTDW
jgi:hypothetical protein